MTEPASHSLVWISDCANIRGLEASVRSIRLSSTQPFIATRETMVKMAQNGRDQERTVNAGKSQTGPCL